MVMITMARSGRDVGAEKISLQDLYPHRGLWCRIDGLTAIHRLSKPSFWGRHPWPARNETPVKGRWGGLDDLGIMIIGKSRKTVAA
jgi:hypothetical protein